MIQLTKFADMTTLSSSEDLWCMRQGVPKRELGPQDLYGGLASKLSCSHLFSYQFFIPQFTLSPAHSFCINCEMVTSSHLMFQVVPLSNFGPHCLLVT
jgi:hypothetical protein